MMNVVFAAVTAALLSLPLGSPQVWAQPQPDDPGAEEIAQIAGLAAVQNGPTAPSTFSLERPRTILRIVTYHWNGGQGKQPGTIGVRDGSGRMYGPWEAQAAPGYRERPNCYWYVDPAVQLPAGTYTVVDSDPATWSHNAETGGRGHMFVWALKEPDLQGAPPAGLVFDETATLSDEEEAELSSLLQAFRDSLGCELAVVLVGPVEDQQAAVKMCQETHNELIAAELLSDRKSGVLLYSGPGTIRAYSRKRDVDEAVAWDAVVAGWREAADTPWPRTVIVQLQAMLRMSLGGDPAPPAAPPTPPKSPATTAPPTEAPGGSIPHPAGSEAGNLEAVAELVETALKQGNIATLEALSVQSLHQDLEHTLAQSPEAVGRLADMFATRRLVKQDTTQAEYEITADDLSFTVRFIRAEDEWLLMSL